MYCDSWSRVQHLIFFPPCGSNQREIVIEFYHHIKSQQCTNGGDITALALEIKQL